MSDIIPKYLSIEEEAMVPVVPTYRICEKCLIEISEAWENKLAEHLAAGRSDIEAPPKYIEFNEPYKLRQCDFCGGKTVLSRYTRTQPTQPKDKEPVA